MVAVTFDPENRSDRLFVQDMIDGYYPIPQAVPQAIPEIQQQPFPSNAAQYQQSRPIMVPALVPVAAVAMVPELVQIPFPAKDYEHTPDLVPVLIPHKLSMGVPSLTQVPFPTEMYNKIPQLIPPYKYTIVPPMLGNKDPLLVPDKVAGTETDEML